MIARWTWLGGGGIVINLETGKVTLQEGYSADEASRLFWDAVEQDYLKRKIGEQR